MFRMIFRISPFLVVLTLTLACSRTPKEPSALVKGRITVNPKLDNTGDYSGIGVTIIFKKDTVSNADTLFHAVTDTAGNFKGTAHFTRHGRYPLIISRNNQTIATSAILLGNKDTVNIQGLLPDFVETMKISSRENTAYKTLQNVETHYEQLVRYLNSGALPQDTIPSLMKTWGSLFWSVHTGYPGTIASDQAAINALNLWQGLDDKKVLAYYDSLNSNGQARIEALNYAAAAAVDINGLNGTVLYLDSLAQHTSNPHYSMAISKARITLLYDSTKINQARSELTAFRQKYDKKYKDAADWSEYLQYDLDNLAPGMVMPEFKVWTTSGDTISNETLKGKPYILEITGLNNPTYQNQYEDVEAIALVYKKFGLQLVTVPIEQSQESIDAFYKKRGGEQWPVAAADAYQYSDILKKLNIQYIPTRFVVDGSGKIVRKYIGSNLDQIIAGLKIAFQKQKQEKS